VARLNDFATLKFTPFLTFFFGKGGIEEDLYFN
jgi:hypothetical protein